MLSTGESIFLSASGTFCRVERLIGVGGQGEVYEVGMDLGSGSWGRFAFKCYHPNSATKEQREALITLVDLGTPSPRFLWPQDLAEISERRTFGYLMEMRNDRFVGLTELVRRKAPTSLRALTESGFQLADSFLALHSRGLCYRDISLGNVFFDPATGDVLICDNDNVAVDGRGHESVLGTSGFMAPEIERLAALPSTRTDLYSLSVLLFLIFINHHPLVGMRELEFACLDNVALKELYGSDPRFIFDLDDASNRPVAGVHDNALLLWPIFPGFLQRLFVQAFTSGLTDPSNGRVRESTWKLAMTRLRDATVRCGCGAELYFDDDLGTVAGASAGRCWSCSGSPAVPPRIQIQRRSVVLDLGTELYPHHLGGDLYDFSHPLARVAAHPLDPRVHGLQNLTQENWVAAEPDGTVHHIGNGRSVRLTDRIRIEFGRAEGTVVLG